MSPVHAHCAGKPLCEINKVEQTENKIKGKIKKKSRSVFQLNQFSKSQQQDLRELLKLF